MIYAFLAVIIIAIILCAPARAELTFKDRKAGGRIFLWKIPIYKIAFKEKEGKLKEQKSPEEKVKVFEKSSKNLGERIKAFASLCRIAVKLIRKLVRIEGISVNICIGTGDAATTAISVGALWAAVYTLLGVVGRIIFIDKHDVKINPDYTRSTFLAEGECIIKSRIVYIIIIAITILVKIKSLKFKEE